MKERTYLAPGSCVFIFNCHTILNEQKSEFPQKIH